jgi:RimJ/RimL family protein N-acetyltransferase
MMDMNGIATGRLKLRPTERQDLPYLMRWWNDPQVMAAVGFPDGLGMTPEAMQRWFAGWVERVDPTRKHYMIVDAATGTPIGEIHYKDLNPRDLSAWIGIKIGERDCWRRGYAKEAMTGFLQYLFGELDLFTVYLDVRAKNLGAQRLYQSLAFEKIPSADETSFEMKLTRESFREHGFAGK